MRIGAPVSGFRDARQWVDLHVEKELGAAFWPLPVEAGSDEGKAYVAAARAADLMIAEVAAFCNPLERDAQRREEGIRQAIDRLGVAERIGARCCVNVSGSYNGLWGGPHPENFSERAFALVVETTQRIIDAVEPRHTKYVLQPMPWTLPHDMDSLERLLEAVDREAFAVHADMTNFLNSIEKVYACADMTRDFFLRFGNAVRSVHAKDFVVGASACLHIDEEIPGKGLFDFDALLSECARLTDVPVMVGRVDSDKDGMRAAAFLRRRAQALHIPLSIARPTI